MIFIDLGRRPFEEAWKKQRETLVQVSSGKTDETVFLVEHPPVFTVGRRGNKENLLSRFDWDGNPLKVISIDRGGDITYHGPGQLVVYPVLDLRHRGRDVLGYLRGLEECVLRTASSFGIEAYRRDGLTGIWTEKGKLASIGITVRRWTTMHGFALNVDPDLRYFKLMHPCGIPECPVTSISRLLDRPVDFEEVIRVVKARFREVYGRD